MIDTRTAKECLRAVDPDGDDKSAVAYLTKVSTDIPASGARLHCVDRTAKITLVSHSVLNQLCSAVEAK